MVDKVALVHIIEDNRALATGIKNVLEIEGYRVRVDHDGVSGMVFARAGRPDLVILDLMLPELNGYQLLRALRAAGATMPVLILSARGEEADKVQGFRIGADDYVTKPFSLLELTARVAALLRRGRAAEALHHRPRRTARTITPARRSRVPSRRPAGPSLPRPRPAPG